jgi:hypothetical protein
VIHLFVHDLRISTEDKDEPRRFLTTGEDANPKDVAVKSGIQKKEVN